MARSTPIYTNHEGIYLADKCLPLIRGVQAGEVRLKALVRDHYPGRKLSRGALPRVKTVGYWDAEREQSWGLERHRDEGIELTWLESGAIDFSVDDLDYQLKPDDLTVTRPWQRHRVGNPNVAAGRLHWLILDVGIRRPHQPWRWPSWLVLTPADRDELTNMLRHNEQPVWHATPEIRGCFQRIAKAVETDRDGSNISRLTVLLNELFLSVLEMFRRHHVPLQESLSQTQRTVELFLVDLRENRQLLAEEWTLRRMARACGLGVTQFVRYCRQLTNMTPVQYLKHFRLAAAASLLIAQPELSVKQVAVACGFSSAQYFATVFRCHFGSCPRDFRAETPRSPRK